MEKSKTHVSNFPQPSPEQVDDLFTYHAPGDETIPKYQAINDAAKAFFQVVLDNAPACADRSAALREIRGARMWANSAIACAGK